MDNHCFIRTKLHRPPVPAEWIDRPSLLGRLNSGFNAGRPVILVSAPAGFGKSTCISRWIDTLSDVPSVWLSLDPSDDDPGCFYPDFLSAFQTIHGDIGREIRGLLGAGEIPSSEGIAAILAADLLNTEKPFLLVLDDFHFIQDTQIHKTLEFLINYPPSNLRMVFITREDPPFSLARLRAYGRLTEIRAADLRFNNREIQLFLEKAAILSLSADDIGVLEMKTEGWPAGLQLATLALESRVYEGTLHSASSFIASLDGRHQYIGKYLAEQVLGHLSSDLRDFLFKTAILEKMNARVCNAVTGRSDSAEILDRLCSGNLFITALDDRGCWYRYHHLFADFLMDLGRNSLSPGLKELHRRACFWYKSENIPDSAIEHALEAEDFPTATELIEEHAVDLIMQGHVKTLDGWIHALPRNLMDANPRINLAFAWMHTLRGNLVFAAPYLNRLSSLFNRESENMTPSFEEIPIKAQWLNIRSLAAYGRGDYQQALSLAVDALQLISLEDHGEMSLALYARASALHALGNDQEAEKSYRRSLKSARAATNQIAELLSTAGLWINAFEHGRLHHSEEILHPVVDKLENSGSLPSMSCLIYGGLAEVYFLWNRRSEARRLMLKALRLSTLGGYAGQIGCRVFLSRLELLDRNLSKAGIYIREARTLVEVDTPAFIIHETVAQEVRYYLAADYPERALSVLEPFGFRYRNGFEYPPLEDGLNFGYSMGLLYHSSLHLLLFLVEKRKNLSLISQGLELVDTLLACALKSEVTQIAILTLLIRARLKAASASSGTPSSDARDDVIHALKLGQPEKIQVLFLEQDDTITHLIEKMSQQSLPHDLSRQYIKSLFSQTAGVGSGLMDNPNLHSPLQPSPVLGIPEQLTPREKDILQCMMEGMKYQEIADSLYVSLNTVRFHVKSIYGKLRVDNRTKAIEKARSLRIF